MAERERSEHEWEVSFWNAVDQLARARYEPGSKNTIKAEKAVVKVRELVAAKLAGLVPSGGEEEKG